MSYIFLFSILFSLFAKLEVCLNYLVNQKYYAEVLCENKEKEDSCCMGKCAMEKELVKLADKEEESPVKSPVTSFKINKSDEAVIKIIKFYPPSCFTILPQIFLQPQLKEGNLSVCFRPPAC